MRTLVLLIAVAAGLAAGAETQIKTADGQMLRGEVISNENGVIRFKTKFGVVKILEKDVVSMGAGGTTPATATPTAPAKEAAPEPKPAAEKSEDENLKFPVVPPPDYMALMATRSSSLNIPEPSKQDRQEIIRLIRNFADTNDSARQKAIRTLQSYGAMVYPFIAVAYTQPWEVEIRLDLLRAVASPNKPLTTAIFSDAYGSALAAMQSGGALPPPAPPDYPTKRDRGIPPDKGDVLRHAASNVLLVESYASTAGGPFNALFLLDIYRRRYSGDKKDPLLQDVSRDKSRLAATASDAQSTRSAWRREDRAMLAEQLFPMFFSDNDDYHDLAKETLKKILPSGYPKWDAPESDWVKWWEKKNK